MLIVMTGPIEKPLVSGEVTKWIRLPAELLPKLRDLLKIGGRVITNAQSSLRRKSKCLEHPTTTGLMTALPFDLYLVNEKGKRHIVTSDTAGQIPLIKQTGAARYRAIF